MDILATSQLLTIMIVVALGTLLGIIPFGPVKLGPAGALFVGLAVGALDPRLGQGLDLVRHSAWRCSSTPSAWPPARRSSAACGASCRVMLSAVVVLAIAPA